MMSAATGPHLAQTAQVLSSLQTAIGDNVSKQSALERLQRQLDSARSKCETLAMRMADVQAKNQLSRRHGCSGF